MELVYGDQLKLHIYYGTVYDNVEEYKKNYELDDAGHASVGKGSAGDYESSYAHELPFRPHAQKPVPRNPCRPRAFGKATRKDTVSTVPFYGAASSRLKT